MAKRAWSVFFLAMLCGFLAGCGRSGNQGNVAHSVSACSLLTVSDASSAMAQPAKVVSPRPALTGEQSACIWQGTRLSAPNPNSSPPSLMLNVSWNPTTVSSFSLVHSGKTGVVEEHGAVATTTTSAPLMVEGVQAYWVTQSIPPGTGPQAVMSAAKDGYVVVLGASGLSQSQVQQALREILRTI